MHRSPFETVLPCLSNFEMFPIPQMYILAYANLGGCFNRLSPHYRSGICDMALVGLGSIATLALASHFQRSGWNDLLELLSGGDHSCWLL